MNILHHPLASIHLFVSQENCELLGYCLPKKLGVPGCPRCPASSDPWRCFASASLPPPECGYFPQRVGVCVGVCLASVYKVPLQLSGRASHSTEG